MKEDRMAEKGIVVLQNHDA